MSGAGKNSRTHVWLDGLGDWSWPGSGGVAVGPPAWVPALPPRLELVTASSAGAVGTPWRSQPALTRRFGLGAALGALAALFAGLAITGPVRVLELAGVRIDTATTADVVHSAPIPTAPAPGPPPALRFVSHDRAGSLIDVASYASRALHGRGSFLVYLPPGYAGASERYPVLYLLHGNGQTDGSFLHIGLQGTLDRLISQHAVPALIAVMIQGGPGANNWRNVGGRNYERYILEVQELVDRMLPTVADRGGRGIAGYSMGGFGAVNLALRHPERFAVVESWLGFFDGLQGELRAGRARLATIGLHAFLYGGASDEIANPRENAPFARELRAAGAIAQSAIYPGGHSFEVLEAHLASMLAFAGRALAPAR